MPSLFRRKSTDLVEAAVAEATSADASSAEATEARPKGYTPSKKELGKITPKRPRAGALREAPPADRKEAARRAREKARAARTEQRAGMLAGDERYLMPRDQGPERALVRDVVDSRLTVGTWFFSFAFVLLVVSSMRSLPPQVGLAANLVWLLLGFGVILDVVLMSRKINRLVRERFPKTQQRMGSLYMYAAMRSLSYRRFRIPKPRVSAGAKI
ncbi:DUF3043 domain-containing protein [Planosporangium sp. 12N6]|uniref:DUF3043 domain-containing protein n=1 Tax=Planosporangium spinosum TaxID=3402278 RepID=UPI003CE6D699